MGYKLAAGRYTGAAGLSTVATSTTLGDSSQAFTVNALIGFRVQSYSSGFPTRGKVASNTATVVTLDANGWDNGTPLPGAPYVVSNLQDEIGHLYHAGLSNGTQFYGYIFEPTTGQDGGFHERSDIALKGQLIQYASPNITDRDIAYWPKVSQGDFSTGMGQAVAVDLTRYWDATLDVRSPNYLSSWPGWNTLTVQGTLVSALNPQVVQIGGKLFVTYGESNFHVYTVVPPASIVTNTGDIIAKSIDTDGYYLYLTDGTKIEQRVATSFATSVTVTTTATVTAKQIWAIQQGTNGRWIFYSDQAFPQSSLYKVDLNGSLPSAGVQVPLGSMVASIVDIVGYLNGVAILTVGGTAGTTEANWDLWFFDGQNTTPIFHRDGYTAFGLCNSQEQLYVTENPSVGTYGKTQLVQVTSGSATTVASLGTPPAYPNTSTVGQPRAIGANVYFATASAAVRSTASQFLAIFNPLTGAFHHTPGAAPTPTGFRTLTSMGEAAVLAYISGSVGGIQYQATGPFAVGGGSPPTLVGSAGAVNESSSSTNSPAFGQATTAGNFLSLTVEVTGVLMPAVAINNVSGWILAAGGNAAGASLRAQIWHKPNCGASETAPVVTTAGNVTHSVCQLAEWTGVAALNPLDATGTASSGDAGSLTVSTSGVVAVANELAITAFAENRLPATTGTWTPGGGWTNLGNDHGTSQGLHGASDYQTNPTSAAVLSELGTSTVAGPNRSWQGSIATFLPATTPIAFGSGGKLVTSRYDFQTPGIKKRLRRLKAIHAPIPTNCSLQIDCYLDKDPVAFLPGLVPDATITNANAGSIATDFFLANLIGHSAYFVLTFITSDNVSTITLNWISVEITTPRAFEFTLDCSDARFMLTQVEDDQGVKAKDLADFFVDAWENPRRLLLFNRDGYAYPVEIQSWERWNLSPKQQLTEVVQAPSEEYTVHVVLSQTVADS